MSDGGGPEFLSSHPNPGDRYDRIEREADLLGAATRTARDSLQFQRVKNSLLALSPAPSMREAISRR
jgi:predicted Zn-dependent protease